MSPRTLRLPRVAAGIFVLTLLALALARPVSAQVNETIDSRERVVIATRVYHQIVAHFPDLKQSAFDSAYSDFVAGLVASPGNRREFDLAAMALVATLNDGHTWFFDDWLGANFGQPLGFAVYRLDGQWTVVRSEIGAVRIGDVIEAVDGTPTEQFFERSKRYISASSDRDAAVSLFDTPVLFPNRFTLTLDGGRRAVIDRARDAKAPRETRAQARWLAGTQIAYVRLPSFQASSGLSSILDMLQPFEGAQTMIVDLRGNFGGGNPRVLQQYLMARPYPLWSESATLTPGPLLRAYEVGHPQRVHVMSADAVMQPRGNTYKGRLILLVDRGCTCACEDFTMPFKVTGRARIVGEATAGTFSFTERTQFPNGMNLNVSAVRHSFPDGSRFEGIGIAPDIVVGLTAAGLKAGRDPALDSALAWAARP